jgi:hypothetical protein
MHLDCQFVHPNTKAKANYRVYGVDANGLFQAVQQHGPDAANRLASALIREKVPMWLRANYELVAHCFVDESEARGHVA